MFCRRYYFPRTVPTENEARVRNYKNWIKPNSGRIPFLTGKNNTPKHRRQQPGETVTYNMLHLDCLCGFPLATHFTLSSPHWEFRVSNISRIHTAGALYDLRTGKYKINCQFVISSRYYRNSVNVCRNVSVVVSRTASEYKNENTANGAAARFRE